MQNYKDWKIAIKEFVFSSELRFPELQNAFVLSLRRVLLLVRRPTSQTGRASSPSVRMVATTSSTTTRSNEPTREIFTTCFLKRLREQNKCCFYRMCKLKWSKSENFMKHPRRWHLKKLFYQMSIETTLS